MADTHTVDQALDRFELVDGPGDPDEGTACAMTLLAWIAGEAWTDNPECANHLLANWATQANDDGTVEDRARIVRAGEHGIIDTWWVPDQVIVGALASTDHDARWVDRVTATCETVAAWKAGGTHDHPDLRGADLRRADLRRADLRGADLSGAVLRDAVLRGADLRDADLRDADLRGADLRGADLRDADLRRADLRGADLRGAVLRDADLRGADTPDWLPTGWTVTRHGYITRETTA